MSKITPRLSAVTALLADSYAPLEKRSDWYCDDDQCDGKPHGLWTRRHCRQNQRPPDGDWFVWLLMSGRGFGKSRTAAEWLLREASRHPNTEWVVVAPTGMDVAKCFNDLNVGINSIAQPNLIKKYNQTLHDAFLNNGAVIHGISADKPDRLRGFNLAGAWCVAEGELVTTRRGNIPIEQVTNEDQVATRQGWKRVVAQKRTGINQPTITINTQDGLSLRCTPNHKILANGVWCEAANLQSGDVLTTWMDHSLTDLPLGGNGKISGGITTPRWDATGDLRDSCLLLPSGVGTTGQSLTGTRSTTSTKTQLTIGWKTWKPWISTSTESTTVQQTEPRAERSGDAREPTPCGHLANPRPGNASNAVTSTKLDQRTQVTAASDAGCGHAIVATVNDSRFNSNETLSDVYDLTVEDAHEFFAGGILVHNCDELSSWRYPDSWDLGLLPALREQRVNPRVVVTTTPKPVTLLRQLVADEQEKGSTVITMGSTFDNADNLAPRFIEEMKTRYQGTRRGRQELYGELLTDVEGALVSQDMIDGPRLRDLPEIKLVRIVVAVDPATTSGENSDETGIIVCAKGIDGRGYVLDDLSCKATPDGWARVVAKAYDKWGADRVIAEKNQGGDMVERIVRSVHPNIAYKGVVAKVGKKIRAEPVAALYEQGKISHVGYFELLEEQWCTWIPDLAAHQKSPDRVDALVHGLTELGLIGLPGVEFSEFMEIEHPACFHCGHRAPKGTPTCARCGAVRPVVSTKADARDEEEAWSLTSGMNRRDPLPDPQSMAVMEMLKQIQGPQNKWWNHR